MNIKAVSKRFSEPSTYAGLAGLALMLGMSVEDYQMYVNAAAGLFGVVSIFLSEGK